MDDVHIFTKVEGEKQHTVMLLKKSNNELVNVWNINQKTYLPKPPMNESELFMEGFSDIRTNTITIPENRKALIDNASLFYHALYFDHDKSGKGSDRFIMSFYNDYLTHILDTYKTVIYGDVSNRNFERGVEYLLVNHGLGRTEKGEQSIGVWLMDMENKRIGLNFKSIRL